MNTRLFKEARSVAGLLATAIATMVLCWGLERTVPASLLDGLFRDSLESVRGLCFFWCGAFFSSLIFGGEFAQNTMQLILAQPVSRGRLWWEKHLILALGLTLLTAAWTVTYPRGGSDDGGALIVAAMAFCSAPFFSMVLRNVVAAAVVLIACPALITLLFIAAYTQIFGASEPALDSFLLRFWKPAAVIYSGAMLMAGFWCFRVLQMADPLSTRVRLSVPGFRFAPAAGDSATWALVKKEIHLQAIPILLAMIYCVIVGILLIVHSMRANFMAESTDTGGICFSAATICLFALVPIMSGGSVAAEERAAGQLEWQLIQPLTARRQWRIKLTVCFLVVLCAAVLLPLGTMFLVEKFGAKVEWPKDDGIWISLVCQFTMTILAIYASSFARTTVRALITAVGLIAGAVTCSMMGISFSVHSGILHNPVGNHHEGTYMLIGLVLVFMALLRSSFPNFRFVQRPMARVVLPLGLTGLAILGVSLGSYLLAFR